MHAVDFLKSPDAQEIGPVVAVYGAEGFLRHEVDQAICRRVFGDEVDSGPTRIPGKQAQLRDVLDTLRTISMWSERQLVIVEDADDFVSDHRAELEKYLEKPARKGILLLDLRTFQSTTRLYKKVSASGLLVDCSPLQGAALPAWVIDQARRRFEKKLDRPAAQQLIELAGNELGLLVQELGKLASYVGADTVITAEAVEAVVGGWRLRTTWEMLDAVIAGRPGPAIQMLDKLMESGDAPQMILGGINWMFRPLAQATAFAREGQPLSAAMSEAGVKPNAMRSGEAYLKRIGFDRATQIGRWLLQTDLDLKGGSALPDRLLLERLLVLLSGR